MLLVCFCTCVEQFLGKLLWKMIPVLSTLGLCQKGTFHAQNNRTFQLEEILLETNSQFVPRQRNEGLLSALNNALRVVAISKKHILCKNFCENAAIVKSLAPETFSTRFFFKKHQKPLPQKPFRLSHLHRVSLTREAFCTRGLLQTFCNRSLFLNWRDRSDHDSI